MDLTVENSIYKGVAVVDSVAAVNSVAAVDGGCRRYGCYY